MPYKSTKDQSPGVIKVFQMSSSPLFSLTCRIKLRNQSPGVIKVFRMSSCSFFPLTCRIKLRNQSPGVMIKVFQMSNSPLFSLTCRIKVQKRSPGVFKVFRMSSCAFIFPHMPYKSPKPITRCDQDIPNE